MIVALGICSADADRAYDLLEWIGELGQCSAHECLLVLDAAVNWSVALALLDSGNRAFRLASVVTTESAVEGWPGGANALWLCAARYAKSRNSPFLWMEPDSIPLRKGWLDEIQKAYQGGFLGHVYDSNKEGLPKQVMSGIAVYPADAVDVIEPLMGQFPDWAWDIAGAPAMLARQEPNKLIQHFWGQPGLAPTFVEAKSPDTPKNAFTIQADVWPEAVLFHRNKDGTLIEQLQLASDLEPLRTGEKSLLVVLPVCNVDITLMSKSLEWMHAIGMPKTHPCLISYDQTTMRPAVSLIEPRAAKVFTHVGLTTYKVRRGTAFPQTAAWQHAARTMVSVNRPWVWLEADNVVLKKDWLLRLQAEYNRCKKSFAGPFMRGRAHINGGAIYPANTPARVPRTMSHTNNAWDVEMATEMMGDCHDIGHLWQCAWGVVHGKLDPIGGDELPSFPKGSSLVNQIRPNAVLFHRDKTGTLIQRLRERTKT